MLEQLQMATMLYGQLKIYNVLTNLVQQEKIDANQSVNIEKLANGIYFIILIDDSGKSYFSKIIVQ